MHKILFICVHNSARSQMAEAYLKLLAGDEFYAESAGFEPTEINPLVVEVMREEGVDLSNKKTQSVFELFKKGKIFEYVVTVCEEGKDALCPIFPGVTHRLRLPFPDPARAQGTPEEQLAQVRIIRDQIKAYAQELIAWIESGGAKTLGDQWMTLPAKAS
jgi:arsenate reductase